MVCNADLIDWSRLDRRDLRDAAYTVQALKFEMIRHFYWHKEVDERALNAAKRKGYLALQESAENRIRHYLGKPSSDLFRDGTQTPRSGNVIYYAQHATATCCRKCAEEWHAIPRNRPLTDDEVTYMVQLISLYIGDRVPSLPDRPTQA